MKKENQKTPKTVEKHETERKKNKAEIFVVCFYRVWMGIAIILGVWWLRYLLSFADNYGVYCAPFCDEPWANDIPSDIILIVSIAMKRRWLILVNFFLCIVFFIFYRIAKSQEKPTVRAKYYKRVCFVSLFFLLVVGILGYMMEYVASDRIDMPNTETSDITITLNEHERRK